MKFQLKTIVAALAAAVVFPAHAAIDAPVTGNSSMGLAVFDREAGVGAYFDLGKNYSDFSVIGASFADSNVDDLGKSFSWDLTSGDYAEGWSTFLGLVNPANLLWSVVGGDNLGSGAGNRGIIATLNQPTVTAITTNPMIAQLGALDSYLPELSFNQVYQNHTLVADGANVANSGIYTNIMTYFQQNKPNAAGSVTVAGIGDSMAVYQMVSGSSAFGATSSKIFENNAKFTLASNGLLTYNTDPVVAIPEADTWAMMLLGLGFMGFSARRKQV